MFWSEPEKICVFPELSVITPTEHSVPTSTMPLTLKLEAIVDINVVIKLVL